LDADASTVSALSNHGAEAALDTSASATEPADAAAQANASLQTIEAQHVDDKESVPSTVPATVDPPTEPPAPESVETALSDLAESPWTATPEEALAASVAAAAAAATAAASARGGARNAPLDDRMDRERDGERARRKRRVAREPDSWRTERERLEREKDDREADRDRWDTERRLRNAADDLRRSEKLEGVMERMLESAVESELTRAVNAQVKSRVMEFEATTLKAEIAFARAAIDDALPAQMEGARQEARDAAEALEAERRAEEEKKLASQREEQAKRAAAEAKAAEAMQIENEERLEVLQAKLKAEQDAENAKRVAMETEVASQDMLLNRRSPKTKQPARSKLSFGFKMK